MTMRTFEKADIERTRALCVLGYFIFFIPLLEKDSRFARFHANQGLVFFLFNVVCGIIGRIFMEFLPLIGCVICGIYPIFVFVLLICGCANAANGRVKRVPFIGGATLLKGSNDFETCEDGYGW